MLNNLQVVMVSDIFSQRHHFEWLLNVLLQVHSVHPVEDELVCQYIVYGVCKASAVAGLVSAISFIFTSKVLLC